MVAIKSKTATPNAFNLPAPPLLSSWSKSFGIHPRIGLLALARWLQALPSYPVRSRSVSFAFHPAQSPPFPYCHVRLVRGQCGRHYGFWWPLERVQLWLASSHIDTRTCWVWRCGFVLRNVRVEILENKFPIFEASNYQWEQIKELIKNSKDLFTIWTEKDAVRVFSRQTFRLRKNKKRGIFKQNKKIKTLCLKQKSHNSSAHFLNFVPLTYSGLEHRKNR